MFADISLGNDYAPALALQIVLICAVIAPGAAGRRDPRVFRGARGPAGQPFGRTSCRSSAWTIGRSSWFIDSASRGGRDVGLAWHGETLGSKLKQAQGGAAPLRGRGVVIDERSGEALNQREWRCLFGSRRGLRWQSFRNEAHCASSASAAGSRMTRIHVPVFTNVSGPSQRESAPRGAQEPPLRRGTSPPGAGPPSTRPAPGRGRSNGRRSPPPASLQARM